MFLIILLVSLPACIIKVEYLSLLTEQGLLNYLTCIFIHKFL